MALAGPARRHISQISSNSRVGPTDPPTIRGIMIRQSVRLPQRNGGRRGKRAGRLRNGGNVSSSCIFGKTALGSASAAGRTLDFFLCILPQVHAKLIKDGTSNTPKMWGFCRSLVLACLPSAF